MFVLVNPAEAISEREKHLRTSVIRSHSASVTHRKRKHIFVSDHFHKAQNQRRVPGSKRPARPILSASLLRPRAPLTVALQNQHEIESVHYLFECGLPHIAGLDDRSFWHDMMTPLMSSNSSLQYTVSALGTALRAWHLQRPYGSTQWTIEESMRLLRSSNMAFKQLMGEDNISLITLLAACIMFTTLSMLANELHEAKQHLSHGIVILNEWSAHRKERSSLEDRAVEESILPVFYSLSAVYGTSQCLKDSSGKIQLIQRRGSALIRDDLVLNIPATEYPEGLQLVMPDSFSTVLVSGQWLRKLAKTFTAHLSRPGTSGYTDAEMFRDTTSLLRAKTLIQAWRSRYDKFLRTHTHELNKTARTIAHHQDAYFHYLFIQLETILCADEMAFDQYESSFRAINAASRALLALGTEESSIQPQRPIFRVESYMMQLLSFTAHHCRHPLVRRQAIELLESNHLEECLTPAGNFAAWSRLLIQIEERDCQQPPQASADITSQQRVRSMEITQLPPRPRPHLSSRSENLIDVADDWLVDEGEGKMTIRLDGRPVNSKPPTTWQGHAGGSVKIKAYSAAIYSTGQFPQQPEILARTDTFVARCRWRRYPYTDVANIESHILVLEKSENLNMTSGPAIGFTHRYDEIGNFDLSIGSTTVYEYIEDDE